MTDDFYPDFNEFAENQFNLEMRCLNAATIALRREGQAFGSPLKRRDSSFPLSSCQVQKCERNLSRTWRGSILTDFVGWCKVRVRAPASLAASEQAFARQEFAITPYRKAPWVLGTTGRD
ncbi:MAG: hypothetical protein ACFFB3_16770, partial [Candidatus Hodarchaeota archaeon]